ncbi:uncharacterized [Tachysurus ichikawai]
MGDLEALLHLQATPSSPVSQAEGRSDGKLCCRRLIPCRCVCRGSVSHCRKLMKCKANPAHTVLRPLSVERSLVLDGAQPLARICQIFVCCDRVVHSGPDPH